jgi:hypothetical protein
MRIEHHALSPRRHAQTNSYSRHRRRRYRKCHHVMGLPYLDQALRVWGRFPGLEVLLMDADTVFRNQLHPPAVFGLRYRVEQGDSTRQSHQPLLGNKLEGRAEKLRRADLRENSGHLDRSPHRLRGQPRSA